MSTTLNANEFNKMDGNINSLKRLKLY